MRETLFPAMMADALGYEGTYESAAYKIYLERFLEDAGKPADPVERMMLQQLALAHLRLGQLHADAGHSKSLEAAKVYNSVTARLWGEFRRTALALRAYRERVPDGRREAKLNLFKMAE
jgi:hypothetical protein